MRTGSEIPRTLGQGVWRIVRTSPSALWQQTLTHWSQSRLWHGILNSTWWMLLLSLKIRIRWSKLALFRVLIPLLRHVMHINDGNWRFIMPVVKGGARDPLPHTFYISDCLWPQMVLWVEMYYVLVSKKSHPVNEHLWKNYMVMLRNNITQSKWCTLLSQQILRHIETYYLYVRSSNLMVPYWALPVVHSACVRKTAHDVSNIDLW